MTRARDIADRNVDSTTIDGVDSTQLLRSDVADTKTAGNLSFSDNVKAQFGAGDDLQMYFDGTNSVISSENTTDMYLQANNIYLRSSIPGAENGIKIVGDGAVEAYYDNAKKLATKSDGVDITGNLSVSGEVDATTRLTVSGASPRVNFTDTDTNYDSRINADSSVGNLAIDVDINSEATAPAFVVNVQGSEKFRTKSDGVDITGELQADSLDIDGAGDISGNLTLGGNLDMSDNDKILLGTSDDLQLFHDGGNSLVTDEGNGSLILRSSNGNGVFLRGASDAEMLRAENSGAVKAYHNGSQKFETTSTGVSVTGKLSVSGNLDRPVVTARKGSQQSISRATWTKVTGFTTAEYDSDSAWDGSRFTVPSGQAGRYLVSCHLYLDFTSAGNDGEQGRGAIYLNGTRKQIFGGLSMANGGRHMYYVNTTGALIYNLGVGDYVEFYAYMQDDSASVTLYVHGGPDNGSQIGIARID